MKFPQSTPTDHVESPLSRRLQAAGGRRTLVGVIALTLLAIAGMLALFSDSDEAVAWMSACLRIGMVMCLLWLAWPQLVRLHPWVILGGLATMVAVLVFAKQPRVLIMGLAILIILARLRPQQAKQSSQNS